METANLCIRHFAAAEINEKMFAQGTFFRQPTVRILHEATFSSTGWKIPTGGWRV
jgi:hypothetical protein